MWFLAAFVALPIIEIVLFIQIGGEIGVWGVLGWLLASAVLGVLLMKYSGMHAMNQLRGSLMQGNPDVGRALVDRALILAAAVLLIVPGFFSDAVALLLLLPPVRGLIYNRLRSRIGTAQFGMDLRRQGFADPNADIIDGDFHRVEQDDPRLPRS